VTAMPIRECPCILTRRSISSVQRISGASLERMRAFPNTHEGVYIDLDVSHRASRDETDEQACLTCPVVRVGVSLIS